MGIAASVAASPPAQLHAQGADQSSLQRIRAALAKGPSPFQAPLPATDPLTFHVDVRAPLIALTPIEETPVDPTYGLPSVGQLLGEGVAKLRSAVVNYKRARARRRARQEVDAALAAFCETGQCPAPRPEP
jgi:hypothetical protein